MKIRHVDDYRKRRKAEYPPIGDQLDVVMKLAHALAGQGFTLPQEVQDWVEHCYDVKSKYPKG